MSEGAEKRRCHRFEIPDAKAKYRKTGLLVLVKGLSKAHPVVNVSKGGVAFLCDETLGEGAKVSVQLLAPNEPPLDMQGHVRWRGKAQGRSDSIVGVQFAPFGEKKGHNSPAALDVLRRLETTYHYSDTFHCLRLRAG